MKSERESKKKKKIPLKIISKKKKTLVISLT